MNLAINTFNNKIGFYGQNDENSDKHKLTTSDVATATGATGAVATGTKMTKGGGFDMFKSSSKVSKMTKETTQLIKNSQKPIKQAKGLFPKFIKAFKSTKADILKWADGIKNSNLLKPLLKSKAFSLIAGTLGFVTGIFVTITGLGDIANTVSEYVNK